MFLSINFCNTTIMKNIALENSVIHVPSHEFLVSTAGQSQQEVIQLASTPANWKQQWCLVKYLFTVKELVMRILPLFSESEHSTQLTNNVTERSSIVRPQAALGHRQIKVKHNLIRTVWKSLCCVHCIDECRLINFTVLYNSIRE